MLTFTPWKDSAKTARCAAVSFWTGNPAMTDHQKLRELLAGLPRVAWSKYRSTVEIPETEDFAGKKLPICGLEKQYARRLAAYIAAVNPLAVSALLDELDMQRQIEARFDSLDAECARLERENDRLSAALAEREWRDLAPAPKEGTENMERREQRRVETGKRGS